MVLEQYVASFERDTTLEVKTQIRRHGNIFNSMYATAERNIAVNRLGFLVDLGDFRTFRKDFQKAFDAFDAQFLEIVKARKTIFKYDCSHRQDRVIDP